MADTTKPKVLVVDDDDLVVKVLRRVLEADYELEECSTGAEALRTIRGERDIDLVLLDVRLPDANGLDILREVSFSRPDTQVIVMTAYGTIEQAVEAVQIGANDFLTKDFENPEIVRHRARRAIEQRELQRKARSLDARQGEANSFSEIVGQSRLMRRVFDLVESVAPSSSTVLIEGGSGTGKELVARAIHSRSARSRRAFQAVNCAALQESLLESELFGHVKGAFTGAVRDKRGIFEAASGGTLFLDEVGEMPASLQPKLLRTLQEGEVRPVGSTDTRRVDVRVVAATNKDLKTEMKEGRFREDLYYRLAVITLGLPTLKERPDDIPLLVFYFLRKFARRMERGVPKIDPQALELLCGYSWPGNVRELENVMERAMLLSKQDTVTTDALPSELREGYEARVSVARPQEVMTFRQAKELCVADFERSYVSALLARCDGNVSEAARQAGVDRSNFRKIMRKYDVSP